MSEFLSAPIDQIIESRWQPREGVGTITAFEELVANVKMHGIKSPLKAFVNEEGTYELITGHRRRQAAIEAGLTHVPLIVVAMPKDGAGLRALREETLFDNLLHEPLTPLEEASAFKALQEEEGYSIRQVAERLGKSRGYITNRLDLLRMPEDVQGLVSSREDTLHHVKEIAKVKDPERRAELIEETKAGASYQDIRARVDQVVDAKDRKLLRELRKMAKERRQESQSQPHHAPGVGTCTAAGQHCPHCGDGRGREICNGCGHSRWIIAFGNIEDYQRALAMVGILIQG